MPETGSAFELLARLKALAAPEAEYKVLLGGRVQLPLRLFVRRLSPKAADARRRKAKKKAKKQGQSCSAAYRFLLGWDILLSNLPPETWGLPQVFDLYRIRFQLEWLFRTWKDQLGVDELGDWLWRLATTLRRRFSSLWSQNPTPKIPFYGSSDL